MIKFFLFFVVIHSFFFVFADTQDTKVSRLNELIELLGEHSYYRLSFNQVNKGPVTGRAIRAEGFLTIQKPDRFKWVYSSTPKNRIVCDGQYIVMIMPDTRQVMIDKAETHDVIWSPVTILTHDHLAEHFDVQLHTETSRSSLYRFYPKRDNQPYDYIELEIFSDDSDTIFSLIIMDSAGSTNTLTFKDLLVPDQKANLQLPEIPEGFDVTDFHGNPVSNLTVKEISR